MNEDVFPVEFSIETLRLEATAKLDPVRRGELGQFLTPSRIAQFMACLFAPANFQTIRLLDAGAGIGTLTAAFLERWLVGEVKSQAVEVYAYEIDPGLRSYLKQVVDRYATRAQAQQCTVKVNIATEDFIEDAVDRLQFLNTQNFTHAILNPPYKKIHSNSQHRKSLRAVAIETVNLYSAFVALAIGLMANGGEIVAIIPRSFCNGPYYRPFRELLLRATAIQHIHLFGARDSAFKDDEVLQENVILHLVKAGVQETVTISTAADETFADYTITEFPFDQIVQPADSEFFIRIPTTSEQNVLEHLATTQHTLAALGVEVSTGPVVDFRLKDYLLDQPGLDTVPLLYPGHFAAWGVEWPKLDSKKPNALKLSKETAKWLYPNDYYTVVRRFSAKEEKRRIVASVVEPHLFNSTQLGFENHLNVFHQGKCGLPALLAYGLATFLNSSLVDDYFRRFNGHTQVNATDLRMLKYPSRAVLTSLGQWWKDRRTLDPLVCQAEIDQKIAGILIHFNGERFLGPYPS